MKIGHLEVNNKFHPGQVVMTPGAERTLAIATAAEGIDALALLKRHLEGDWGEETPPEDKKLNESSLSVKNPGRLMSAYKIGSARIWIITEWDRSVTTLLLPEEY